MWKKILSYLLLSTLALSAEYTLEELNKLKELNLISNDEYEVFKNELLGTETGENLYTLSVNSLKVSQVYPILKENNRFYFPVINLFNTIGFTNYKVLNGVLEFTLGTNNELITINSNKNFISGLREEKTIHLNNKELITTNSDFYIESELFKKIFLESFKLNEEKYSLSMGLSFETPEEVKRYLRNTEDGLVDAKDAGEIMFTNKKTIFDLGNLGINVQGFTERNEGDKKFNTDWSGNLEYQGSLLYGEFTMGYDVRNNEVGTASLYYPDIWKEHSLDIVNSSSGSSRAWEFTFRKEKGYFRVGRNFTITENVPIGSKVELLYLGFPIDIQQADNGVVEFNNPEIQENRTYVLRVYTPEGKIYTIDINTTDDYNQQKRGEIEYDISFRENTQFNKYETNANVYYGITDNFTTGFNYSRTLETGDNNETGYLDTVRGEGVYSNTVYSLPYTLVLGGEKAISTYKSTEGDSDKDRYGFDYTGQIDVKNFKFIASGARFGKYFDEKQSNDYSITYNPGGLFQVNYNWGHTKYYDGSKDSDESVGFNVSKAYKDLLVTFDYNKALKNDDTYRVNLYYNGLVNHNVQLSNEWSEKGNDFETILSVSNKNIFDILDYTVELSYSEVEKEKFTFSISLDYESWFTTDIDINGKNQRYAMGIDKVVDLKDIRKNVESLDSSRVKITTYLDENNNGVRDNDEKTVKNVYIKLREEEQITDEDGVAWFHGIPNNVTYELKPTIRTPDQTLTEAKLKVLGRQVGTIEAEIPVKPLLNLTGALIFDSNLKISAKEKEGILENTLIKILNSKGKLIEYINPESDGSFEINGLYNEKYTVEILYMGTDYDIQGTAKNIQLAYKENSNNLVIQYKNGKFSIVNINKEEGLL